MLPKVSLEDLLAWFQEGEEESEDLLNLRWTLLSKSEEDGRLVSFRVAHPRAPVTILVLDLERSDSHIPVVRMAIETGVTIGDLDTCEKHILMRGLLEMSKLPLAKYYTIRDEEEIVVAVDLDKKGLTREEASEALATLLLAYTILVDKLPEKLQLEAFERATEVLGTLVRNWYRGGVNMERARDQLIRAGVPEKVADKIIDKIYGSMHI